MNDIEIGIEDEFRLARLMKNDYCYMSGKETDSTKAAEIIHKIGVIYRKRSPDKLSLIKCAGLFNAAIVRNPLNITQIKSDLFELCQHILQQAKAKNQKANLVKKSEHIKTMTDKLRKEVNAFIEVSLKKISAKIATEDFQTMMPHKLSAIQHINKTIADKYKQIIVDISQFCEDVMGKPPCQYAIAGMGSLAREEITPYSDFEHIILLENDKNYYRYLEYFRWFSVIFHVTILNVQETIIPSLNVRSFNDKDTELGDWYYDNVTPRGLSFDGMMCHACKFPLGRIQHTKNKPFATELIKPVNEMLEYLSSESDLKNGYHLADMLTKTCFVFGNETIFEQFVDGVQNYRTKKSKTETINNLQQQVKDDLNKFSTRFQLSKLKSYDNINIKQLVYRSTTLFIAAMATLHNISANSSFDTIEKMVQNNIISQNTAEKLRHAIAIACEMRLRVYMKMKSQNDNAIDLKNNGILKFLDIVGAASTIYYFQIAYCLQCEVAKQLKFTKLHFYTDPQLINITIGLAFEMKDLISFSENPQNRFWDSNKFDFDACSEQLEKKINMNITATKLTIHSSSQSQFNPKEIERIANYLHIAEIYDEALEFNKQLLEIYQRKSKNKKCDFNTVDYDVANVNIRNDSYDTKNNKDVARTLNNIGHCHSHLCNYTDALTFLNRALKIYQNITLNADKDTNIANTLNNVGLCHMHLCNYSNALTFLKRVLQIYQNTTIDADKDVNIADTLNNIGRCNLDFCNYTNALTCLNRAHELYQNITVNAEKDTNVANTLNNIGVCHLSLCNFNDALTYLNCALEIHQNITLNAGKDTNIAMILNNIGNCHSSLCNFTDALTILNRVLQIYQSITLNADKDINIAKTLHNIGLCRMRSCNYADALTFLNRALQMYQIITPNADQDTNIAKTLNNIGCCHAHLCKFSEALTFLYRALKNRQYITLNTDNDENIANTLNNIGACHRGLGNHNRALTFLNRALEIHRNTTLNADKDQDIANTLNNIGACHSDLCNYTDAMTFLNRAFKIYQNITLNAVKDTNIANMLNNIGACHISLCNYIDALIFLNRALKVYQNITFNADKDLNIADTLYNIGLCHKRLCNYTDALAFSNRALKVYQNITLNADKDTNNAKP